MKAKKPGDAMRGSDPGVVEAQGRNPNSVSEVNGAPEGPTSHHLGQQDDGGYSGSTSVKGRHGGSFNFK